MNRRLDATLRTGLCLALFTTLPPVGLALTAQAPDPPTQEEHRGVRKSEADGKTRHREQMQQALLQPGAVADAERYTIAIRVIPPPTRRVEGTVRIQARAVQNNLTILPVDLYDAMGVTAVTTGLTPLSFTRGANKIQITLDHAYATGQLIDVTIAYGGTPPAVNDFVPFAFGFNTTITGNPIIWSLSEPGYAPTWWPCLEHPADKAIVDMDLRVPSTLTGVSNGVLIGVVTHGDGTTTYQWRSSYAISTYLVSVAISNYVTWTDFYAPVTGGPVMPVQHWVYPEKEVAARIDLNVTVPMLTFFSGLFGEYPFVTEKYGHALFPFGGGMEHQTCTSYGQGLIRGDHAFDWVVAHELAHQWWGDSVGPADWPEIWLNEGFATYSEALWNESIGGAPGLRNWMTLLDSRPFCGTVYNPEGTGCDLFGSTVYDKGGWVLHMLRRVVGDTAFFQGLHNYHEAFQGDNATTAGFRDVMEAASGLDLDTFINQWVYTAGEPVYTMGWLAASTPAGWVTHVRIEQPVAGPTFVMPIDLKVTWAGGSQTFVVQNSAQGQDFALPPVPQQPITVTLDPDLWILKTVTPTTLPDVDADGVPNSADNCQFLANPAQEDLDGDGAGDGCDPDLDGDGRANLSDCAPADATAQDPPTVETVGLLLTGSDMIWTPVGGAPVTWTYDVVRGSVQQMRADHSMTGAACYATGLASASSSDAALPPAADAFYYLVRIRNTCGVGPLGAGSPGAPPRPSPGCP